MMTLFTPRRFAAVATVLILMVGGLGLGASSAMAKPTGTTTELTGFPSNPTFSVKLLDNQYVVGGDGKLYQWANDVATLVQGAPKSITNAVVSGSYLYVLSQPEGRTAKIQRFDGSVFANFSQQTPTGLMVADGVSLVSTIKNSDGPALESRGSGGDNFTFFEAPTGLQDLTVFQNKLYIANSTGLWVSVGFDFKLIPGTPTGIIGSAIIGDTLYLRSATHIYSYTATGSVLSDIATISTTAMTVANDRLYVKRAASSEILILGDDTFIPLPLTASGEDVVTMGALLIFANSTSVYSYDGPAPEAPIVSSSTSSTVAAVTRGPLTASLSGVVFAEVPFSHAAQSVTSTATLAADDQTGMLSGWDVTLQASDLMWVSPSGAVGAVRDIPAANLALVSAGEVSTIAGDAFSGVKLSAAAALGSAVSVVSTAVTEGNGSYTVPLGFSLAIPANAPTGTYTGTLTTTITAAP